MRDQFEDHCPQAPFESVSGERAHQSRQPPNATEGSHRWVISGNSCIIAEEETKILYQTLKTVQWIWHPSEALIGSTTAQQVFILSGRGARLYTCKSYGKVLGTIMVLDWLLVSAPGKWRKLVLCVVRSCANVKRVRILTCIVCFIVVELLSCTFNYVLSIGNVFCESGGLE